MYKRASLDTVVFKTRDLAEGLKTDNSFIMMPYMNRESNKEELAYGQLTRMFQHKMYPGNGAPSHVIVDCEWYSPCEDKHPGSGLTQVKRNPNFDRSRLCFLKDCIPANFVLWPAKPYEGDEQEKWVVITHH